MVISLVVQVNNYSLTMDQIKNVMFKGLKEKICKKFADK